MRNAPKAEQIRHLWSNLAKYGPEVRRVHHIIFPDALLRGIFATQVSYWVFSDDKKMYLNIELNYYETYRNRKRSSEKGRDECDAF